VQHLHHRTVPLTLAVAAAVALAIGLAAAFTAPRSAASDADRTPGEASSVREAGAVARAASAGSAAGRFPIGGPDWQRALGIAVAYWGGTMPCGGEVQFAWTTLEPLTNARATWHNPTHPWNNPAENFECRVDFNASTAYDFPQLCTVMTHELGHLHGHPHAATPGQLMSPIYSDPLPECVDPQSAPSAPQPVAVGRAAGSAHRGDETASKRTAERRARRAKARRSKARRGTTRQAKRCFVRLKAGRRVRMCITPKSTKRCFTRMRAGRRVRLCVKRTTGRRKGERLSVRAGHERS
jgi:hypothetical protein